MQWRRRVVLFALLAAVLLALGYGFRPRPVVVDVARATRGPLRVTVEEEGKTRVIDRFVVSAPVPGFARRVDLDVGDPVTQGQVLLDLEPLRANVLDRRSRAEAEARVAAAKAALNAARERALAAAAEADYAETELERLKRLYEARGTSQEALDQADAEARRSRATCRSSEFAVEVARFELDAARTALRYSAAEDLQEPLERVAIKAPGNGRVLKIQHQSEGVVSAGQALLEVGNPCALEVEVDVLSADAVRIAPGTRVLFERWGGDAPLEGRVRVVEPVGFTKISALGVEEQRVLVIAELISPPETWVRLGDGYRVEASFILWEGENVLQIPASALFRASGGWAVFVLENKKARHCAVQVGHRSGLSAEIVAGLVEGEEVITHPDEAIGDGTRVRRR